MLGLIDAEHAFDGRPYLCLATEVVLLLVTRVRRAGERTPCCTPAARSGRARPRSGALSVGLLAGHIGDAPLS
ncbi:MAG: hypothetical protein IPG81_14940 [Sandaracinaceae bacterium]|nr:hypothetical protein [Sandaracinaceae bacterium]